MMKDKTRFADMPEWKMEKTQNLWFSTFVGSIPTIGIEDIADWKKQRI
jgi:hypothetical protein